MHDLARRSSGLPCMQFTAASAQPASRLQRRKTPIKLGGVRPRGKRNIRDIQLSGWRKAVLRSVSCRKSVPDNERRRDGHWAGNDPLRPYRGRGGRGPHSDAASAGNVFAIRYHFDGGPERATPYWFQLVPRKRVCCRGSSQPWLCPRSPIRSHFDHRGGRSESVGGFGGAAARSVRVSQCWPAYPTFR